MKFKIYKKNNSWFLQFNKNDFQILLKKAVKKYIENAVFSYIETNRMLLYYAEIALYLFIVAHLEIHYLDILTK